MLRVWEPTSQNDGQCEGTVRQGSWGRQHRLISILWQVLVRMRLPFRCSLVLCLMARSFSLDGRLGGPPGAPAEWALFLCRSAILAPGCPPAVPDRLEGPMR